MLRRGPALRWNLVGFVSLADFPKLVFKSPAIIHEPLVYCNYDIRILGGGGDSPPPLCMKPYRCTYACLFLPIESRCACLLTFPPLFPSGEKVAKMLDKRLAEHNSSKGGMYVRYSLGPRLSSSFSSLFVLQTKKSWMRVWDRGYVRYIQLLFFITTSYFIFIHCRLPSWRCQPQPWRSEKESRLCHQFFGLCPHQPSPPDPW